jgi:hypothetical protein
LVTPEKRSWRKESSKAAVGLSECIGLNSTADAETLSVQRQATIEEALLRREGSELSAYSAVLLGVNLIELLGVQDSIKAWSVLQKDQYPQDGG